MKYTDEELRNSDYFNRLIKVNKQSATVLNKIVRWLDNNKKEYITIENPPYMKLSIEFIYPMIPVKNESTDGTRCISVCHYGELNGDLMRDPEIVYFIKDKQFYPVYFRNDYVGVEQFVYRHTEDGTIEDLYINQELVGFTALWIKNMVEQGFLEKLGIT
jgi:hypothetical protein